MKLYHFALAFAVIAVGFFVTAQTCLLKKMQGEELKQTEYDCLVAAVNAATEVAFAGASDTVTAADLLYVEEVFFQTLAVVHDGTTDRATWTTWKERIPFLAVLEERGYYIYRFVPEQGYEWSELIPYKEGKISEAFYLTAETILSQYHNTEFHSEKRYRMEQAGKGVWEQTLLQPCVFAVYAPDIFGVGGDADFLYAASRKTTELFFVTKDKVCHLPFCEYCVAEEIVARYSTQRESAEDGAVPCEECMK